MAKYKQLSKDERITIEEMLNKGSSFREIAFRLQRSKSTIAREVQRNSHVRQTGCFGKSFNNCANRITCVAYKLCDKEDCRRQSCCGCKICFKVCPDFVREDCADLNSPPYVCNGCPKRLNCTLEKFIYEGPKAHRISVKHASDSRSGIATSVEEINRIDSIISPLLKQGQSIQSIASRYKDELMVDEKTLYKYVKLGLFEASAFDLLNVVKMKPRRKKPTLRVEKDYLKGRTYKDFILYMQEHPDTPVVQMDTLEGKKGVDEPVLLTIHFVESSLMLAFKRNANTAASVARIFNELHKTTGEQFEELFPVILTDRGSEFSKPSSIEADEDGVIRTRIFYADAGAPYQKGACENNHALIRRIIPKGTSFKDYTQKDINLVMSHINSYQRKKLKGKSPFSTFSFFHGRLILKKLGIVEIAPDKIVLNPPLLK